MERHVDYQRKILESTYLESEWQTLGIYILFSFYFFYFNETLHQDRNSLYLVPQLKQQSPLHVLL